MTDRATALRSEMAEATPEADSLTQETPASLPLYVAAWVVALSGLFAVNAVLEEPAFANLTFALMTIGFAVSYISRRQALPSRNLQLAALVAFAGVCVITLVGGPAQATLIPVGAGEDRSKAVAVFLTWMMCIGSFALTADACLLFMCVPALALIGLVSTAPVDAPLVWDFVVYIGAASFMMVHENYLRTGLAARSWSSRRSGPVLLAQIALAGLCLGGSAIAANLVASPLHVLGSYVSLSAGIIPVNRPWRRMPISGRIALQESTDRQVGTGPVQLSDQIVLKVQTDMAGYLRGQTYDLYTGRGWRNSYPSPGEVHFEGSAEVPRTFYFSSGSDSTDHTFRLPPGPLTTTGPTSRKVHEQVKLQAGVVSEVYAVGEARTVRISQLRLVTDGAGGVHLAGPIQSGSYEVDSEVPDSEPSVLRSTPMRYPVVVRMRYLPQSARLISGRLVATAHQIADRQPTAYDKAAALEQWLSRNCKYNLSAPPVPESADVADYFIFESREGYCDSFATALALLCRAVGIPARVASGFLAGEKDAYTRDYLVRDRDRHMWTEVYFAGVGWVPFDATGDAEDISPHTSTADRRGQGLVGFLFGRGVLPPLALLALAVILGYVLYVEVLQRRMRARVAAASGLGLPEANIRIVQAYDTACALLARKGLPRSAAETPVEYLRSSAEALNSPEARQALGRLTALCMRFRYSGETAMPSDADVAREALRELREALRSAAGRIASHGVVVRQEG